MTFDMIRLGLPNAAAIVALAIMPVVALALADPQPAAAPIERVEATAAICQAPVPCTEVALAATLEFATE